MAARYELAKRGYPTFGFPPFGYRVVNNDKSGQAVWEIIPECKRFLQTAADLYLTGKYSYRKLAKLMRDDPDWGYVKECSSFTTLDPATLANLFYKSAECEYVIKLKDSKYEKVKIKLPDILLEKITVKLIKDRSMTNRVIKNRQYIRKYPLSGSIFCSACGQSLIGFGREKYRYYRHNNAEKITINCVSNVNAKKIENAVFYEFSNLLNNQDSLQKAVNNTIDQDLDKIKHLKYEAKKLDKIICRKKKERERYLDDFGKEIKKSIRESLISRAEDIDEEIDTHEDKVKSIRVKIEQSKQPLNELIVSRLVRKFQGITSRGHINALSDKQKKELIRYLVGGETVQERKRLGVGIYVSNKLDSEVDEEYVSIEIKGILMGEIRTTLTSNPYVADKYQTSNFQNIEFPNFNELMVSWGITEKVVPEKRLY